MIFLYTINNTDVLLLSCPRRSGFIMKQLSPPPSKQGPWEHQFGPPPPFPTTHLCRWASLQEIHQDCIGMNRSCELPPGERGQQSYESVLSYEKHSGGVLQLPDEHLRCALMLLAGADCRICMQRPQQSVCLGCPTDNVPDKIMHRLSKKNGLFKH